MNRGEIIIYQTPDGTTNLEVRLENNSVYANFAYTAAIVRNDGKRKTSVCSKMEHTANDRNN